MKSFIILFFFSTVQCSPVQKASEVGQSTFADEERHFANGTVFGKCTYLDKEGDPVHVKYYAHKGGYGVELQSVKVSRPAQTLNQIPSETNLVESSDNMDERGGIAVGKQLNKEYIKLKEQGRIPSQKFIRKDPDYVKQADETLGDYNNAQMYAGNKDYEIFLANRLKHMPDDFEKKKMTVRNKSKRLLRNVGWKCLHNND